MELPKLNERKQQSKVQQTMLKLKLMEVIDKFEEYHGYTFEPYEVDDVLLDMIKRNHEEYLKARFGNERTD